jgi:hypothetical protein
MSSYTCIPVHLEKIFLRSSGLCKSFHCDHMVPSTSFVYECRSNSAKFELLENERQQSYRSYAQELNEGKVVD